MSDERESRLVTLFQEISQLDAEERQHRLAEIRTSDPELAVELDRLLDADGTGSILDRPITLHDLSSSEADGSSALGAHRLPRPEIGRTIGPYRIMRLLGKGGMGEVYLAEQVTPVERQVAIKFLRAHLKSPETLARFEGERQALALLDSPNVARILDVGTSDEGGAFFALEFVDGTPITEYCDQHALSIDERLRLFLQVCRGLADAHHRGIIHRDIKPTNILVADDPDGPVAKIIDFGIARLGEANSRQTLQGTVLGTPDYMSPEQADTAGFDVDTRSDIYSAGVVLFELLAGALPLERTNPDTSYVQALQQIATRDVPRLTERLSTLDNASARAQRRSGLSITQWRRCLQGELEWIVSKALQRDRSQRYQSIGELASDLRGHLAGDPITVGPPTIRYRLRKLARRHRGVVVAGGLGLTMLFLATITSSTFYLREQSAYRNALRSATEEGAAKRQAEHAVNFLRRVVMEMNSRGPSGEVMSLPGALAVAMDDLDMADLSSEESASAKSAVASILSDMNLRSMARLVYESALTEFDTGEARALDHALCILELAELRSRFDRDPELAAELTHQALQIAELRLPEDDLGRALLHDRAARVLERIGQPAAAEAQWRLAIEGLRSSPSSESQPEAAVTRHEALLRLAYHLQKQAQHEEALTHLEEAQRLAVAAGINNDLEQARAHKRLERANEQLGQTDAAHAHRDASQQLIAKLSKQCLESYPSNLATAPYKSQDNRAFIYGRVRTRLGDEYAGILRWGTEEAFWDDLFNGSKMHMPYSPRSAGKPAAPEGTPPPTGPARWKTRFSYESAFEVTILSVRYGDISRIDIPGDDGATLLMKSGEIVEVGGGTNDVNGTLFIHEAEMGPIAVAWSDIETITFEGTPADLQVPAYRLYGRVTTTQGSYEGYVQWDNQECLSTDILDARTMHAQMNLAMGRIVSIEQRTALSSQVQLDDGQSLHLGRSNDVDERNRGIMVENPDIGRILIPYEQFVRVDFEHVPTSGAGYEDYTGGGTLLGTVLEVDDTKHHGRILFDLDEAHRWESLGGSQAGVRFEVPFTRIASLIPMGKEGSKVILQNGTELHLQSGQDVSQSNAGVMIFAVQDDTPPPVVEWARIRRIDFATR